MTPSLGPLVQSYLALEVMGIGQRGPLDRDSRNLLAGCEHLGHSHREVSEEGVQRGSTLTACADGVAALLLQVLQEHQNPFECQIINFIDHLPVQKGLRVGSIRSYRDTIRLFLCFVSGQRRSSISSVTLLEPLRVPLGMAPVRARHVIRQRAVPWSTVAALMRGYALTAVEHFHRALRQPCLDLLTDQSVRDRIGEPGNFDVVVDPDPGEPPFGELLGPGDCPNTEALVLAVRRSRSCRRENHPGFAAKLAQTAKLRLT